MNTWQLTKINAPATQTKSFTPVRSGLLQRKCACGGTPGPTGECEACRNKRLQREVGNPKSEIQNDFSVPSVVDEVLRSPGPPLEAASRAFMEPRFGHDFSRMRLNTSAHPAEAAPHTSHGNHELTHVMLQSGAERTAVNQGREEPKIFPSIGIRSGQGARSHGALELSEPSNSTEREAKQVSERLFPSASLSKPDLSLGVQDGPIAASANARRRKNEATKAEAPCTTCGGSSKLPGGMADPGRPLPAQTRTEMEHAFRTDLSAVRIHTNPGAAQLTRSLKAKAFTYGNDIFFDQGRYDSDSASGKRLLAHELTHTVQQRDSIAMLAREGEGRTTLQCVNENLSSAGVAAWLLAIVGTTCGLIFGIAGSPTGPGAAGTAAFGAAVCIAGVIGASVGAVLGVISGCWSDPNFKSRGANLK